MTSAHRPLPTSSINETESTHPRPLTDAADRRDSRVRRRHAWYPGMDAAVRCSGRVAVFAVTVTPPAHTVRGDHLGPHSPIEAVLYLGILLVLLALLVAAVRRR